MVTESQPHRPRSARGASPTPSAFRAVLTRLFPLFLPPIDPLHERPARPLALGYALPLFLAAISWFYWYNPHTPTPSLVYISSALELGFVFWAYLNIDSRLRDGAIRFCLAGSLALFTTYVVVDAYLLRVTSIRLHHAFSILQTGGSFFLGLEQAGFTRGRLVQIGSVLAAAFVIGGLLHRFIPRAPRWRLWTGWTGTAIAALLAISMTGEQANSRSKTAYAIRELIYPGYVQLFPGDAGGFTELQRPPLSQQDRRAALAHVTPPARPMNVLYFLLESVDATALKEGYMPNLTALANESLNYTNVNAAGSFTYLSWNVILMDRPAWNVWLDCAAPHEEMGGWPFEIFRAAGYKVQASLATEMDYKGYHRRLVGSGDLFTDYFQGVVLSPDIVDLGLKPFPVWDMAQKDVEAADHAVDWIGRESKDKPFVMIVQLDETHFPYHFHSDDAVARPYMDADAKLNYGSATDLNLMRGRYCNSLHGVDRQLGRVVDALKAAGLYDNTAIVVVPDHGESFQLGAWSHTTLNEATRHIPVVMRLPGLPAQCIDKLVSQIDIWPTVFNYINIGGLSEDLFLGHSMLPGKPGRDCTMTVEGDMQVAEVVMPDYTVRFRVKHSYRQVTFLPIRVTASDGREITDSPETFARAVAEAHRRVRDFLKSDLSPDDAARSHGLQVAAAAPAH